MGDAHPAQTHKDMILPKDIEDINDHLLTVFGKITDKPRFRLVWSENEQEFRRVEYINKMQLVFPSVELTRKYSYIRERYILEKWFPDLQNYEPIWVFEDSKLEFIMPIWRAVEMIAIASDDVYIKGLKDYASEDESAMKKEVEYFEDMLGDGNPYGNQSVDFVKPVYLNNRDMEKK